MKKLLLSIIFIASCSLQARTNLCEQMFAQLPAPARTILGVVLLGAAYRLLPEIPRDMGHRHLLSKQEALEYEKILKKDSKGTLSEKEINLWKNVQYFSTVPLIWWREISATALLALLVYAGTKGIKTGIYATFA